MRVPNRFFGIRDFPYLKLGIRDIEAKSGRDSGLKVCARVIMPEITLRITGSDEILGRDYGIEEPYWGPYSVYQLFSNFKNSRCFPSNFAFGYHCQMLLTLGIFCPPKRI